MDQREPNLIAEELRRRKALVQAYSERLGEIREEQAESQRLADLQEKTRVVLTRCGAMARDAMKQRLEPVLTAACQTVYPNRSCSLEFTQRRGLYDVDLMVQTDSGVHGDPRNDTFGGGLCDLLSLAARIALASAKSPARVVCTDEGMKFLGRMAGFGAQFLKGCTKNLLDQVIMVTHEERFEDLADALYEAERVAPDTCVIRPVREPGSEEEESVL